MVTTNVSRGRDVEKHVSSSFFLLLMMMNLASVSEATNVKHAFCVCSKISNNGIIGLLLSQELRESPKIQKLLNQKLVFKFPVHFDSWLRT